MSGNIPSVSWAYVWVTRLLRLACDVFFRRIEVVGLESLPSEGDAALILCGNHPNSLLDPVLMTCYADRVVHFAAKDVLFQNRLLRPILRALGAVPVRRKKDHGGDSQDNSNMFEAMHAALAQGRAVGIFPEGISHDATQLAPLKTGAARIALGARKALGGLPIYLVPTGLVYEHRNRFRTNVFIQFGEPILVGEHWFAKAEDDPIAASKQLTAAVQQHLTALTVNADSWETLRVLDAVRRMYQPRKTPLEERVRVTRRFNLGYPEVKDNPDVAEVFSRVSNYLTRQTATGLSDRAIARGFSARRSMAAFAGHMVLLLIYLPLFVIGSPVNVPTGLLLKIAGNHFAPRSDVIATTKFVGGMMLIVVIYGSLTAYTGWTFGWPWGLAMAGLLPATGIATVRVLARLGALQSILLTASRMALLHKEAATLREERAILQAEAIALIDKYRHVADDMEAEIASAGRIS